MSIYASDHYRNFVNSETIAMVTHNATAIQDFNQELENWRQNTLIQRALKIPEKAPPTVPILWELDLPKLTERYWAWANTVAEPEVGPFTRPSPEDWWIYKPMPVAPNAFLVGVETPKPQPSDPISQVDPSTPGRWNIASGDRTPRGTMLAVAFPALVSKYGNLRRMTKKGVMNVDIHFWQAASNDPHALAIWQKAVDRLNRAPEEEEEESWQL